MLRSLFVYVQFKQVMPVVINVMKAEASLVTLVKPQFEARRSQETLFFLWVCFNLFGALPTQVSILCSDMKLIKDGTLIGHVHIVFTIFLSCICAPILV